jgi:hypothetical protein
MEFVYSFSSGGGAATSNADVNRRWTLFLTVILTFYLNPATLVLEPLPVAPFLGMFLQVRPGSEEP